MHLFSPTPVLRHAPRES